MWYLILLYILPGMITTWLLPKFVEYQGGLSEFVSEDLPDLNYDGTLKAMGLIPLINFISLPLLVWYVLENFKSSNCGD